MYKQLRQGEGTGSPYSDCKVTLKVRVEIDGQITFSHDDPLATKIDASSSATYDLEEYQLPAVVRKVLKKQKMH